MVVHLEVILYILQGGVIIPYHQVGIFAHDVNLLNLLLVEFIEHAIIFLLIAEARFLDAFNCNRIVEHQKSSFQLHGSYLGEIEQGFLHVLQLQEEKSEKSDWLLDFRSFRSSTTENWRGFSLESTE